MPITQSAKKALRQERRRRIFNLRIKKKLKASIKQARKKPTKKNLKLVFSTLDRAAKKKIIHKNKATRLKSRISKKKTKKP